MPTDPYNLGTPAPVSSLKLPEAISLAKAVQVHPCTKLENVFQEAGKEAVVFECSPDLPQRPPIDIRASERIAVVYSENRAEQPIVLALRESFPLTPHQNLTKPGNPKSLCLFEEPYREIRNSLTSALFINRIGEWLACAATNSLHQPGQALEPFTDGNRVIFNEELLSRRLTEKEVLAAVIDPDDPVQNIRLHVVPTEKLASEQHAKHIALVLEARPSANAVIAAAPQDLNALASLFSTVGIDLIDRLKQESKKIFLSSARGSQARKGNEQLQQKWCILLRLPKQRYENGDIETIETWCFIVLKATVVDVARRLDVLNSVGGTLGVLLSQPATTAPPPDLTDIQVLPCKPTFFLNRTLAAKLSGIEADSRRVICAGAGALGSQVALNLARQGLFKWNIVDEDILLPHNFQRHGLASAYLCKYKAHSLADEICQLLDDGNAARPIRSDILMLDEGTKGFADILAECDLLFDFTASRAAMRHISKLQCGAVRISAYITGDLSLIVLKEGDSRSARLDDLDMQLAAATLRRKNIRSLLVGGSNRVPYAGACREVSAVLSPETVAVYAATAASFIRLNRDFADTNIELWKYDPDRQGTEHISIMPAPVYVRVEEGWEVRLSQSTILQMRRHRRYKLPSETGGVLLGATDVSSRTIYVSAALAAPPDSKEYPNSFIRGAQGLKEALSEIYERTGHSLTYVGEWHSHPKGCSTSLSEDDRKALAEIGGEMARHGLPAFIAIVGDVDHPNIAVSSS